MSHVANRTRWVLVTMTIASFALLGATWNSSLSWIRTFAESATLVPPVSDPVVEAQVKEPVQTEDQKQLTADLRRRLLRTWVESTWMSVPLLGLRFSSTDASVVGSVALLLLSVWFFFSMRRENHVIGYLFNEVHTHTQHQEREARATAFHGVIATQLFATFSEHDLPISTLTIEESRSPFQVGRALAAILFYLPCIAISCVLLSDLMSIFLMPALFRGSREPLLTLLLSKPQVLWSMGARMAIGLFVLILTYRLISRARAFQTATMNLLQEVAERWFPRLGKGPELSTGTDSGSPVAP